MKIRGKHGASERTRTSDLLITKGLLQLFKLLIINVFRWGAQSIVLRLREQRRPDALPPIRECYICGGVFCPAESSDRGDIRPTHAFKEARKRNCQQQRKGKGEENAVWNKRQAEMDRAEESGYQEEHEAREPLLGFLGS